MPLPQFKFKPLGWRIHQTPCGIAIYQNRSYRWLTFQTAAIQTRLSRRDPTQLGLGYMLPMTLAAKQLPGSVCLLGLGGGGLAHALPHLPILAIEHHPIMIDLARTYFKIDTLPLLTLQSQDAFDFLQKTPQQFKHILVDIADAQGFPASCFHADFFIACYQRLLSQGVLSINLTNSTEAWQTLFYLRHHLNVQPLIFPVKDGSNVVIVVYKGEGVMPLIQLLQPVVKAWVLDEKWGIVGGY